MTTASVGIRSGNTVIPYAAGSSMPAGTIISTCEDVTAWTQVAAAQTTGTGNDQSVAYVKDGWALCNGAILTKSSFPNLAAKIAIGWNIEVNPVTGESRTVTDTTNNFRLPDFRGTFLRGVADYALSDAYSTDNDVTLAAYKVDKVQGHYHQVDSRISSPTTQGSLSVTGNASNADFGIVGLASIMGADSVNGTPRIGKETNPKQVGVYYLVKLYDNLSVADVYIAPASASVSGLVDTAAQIFAGVKTFTSAPVAAVGLSAGTGNTALMCKTLTGMTGVEGSSTGLAHGLTFSKIRSVIAVIFNDTTSGIPPNYTLDAELEYTFYFDGTNVVIRLHPTNSGSLTSKTIHVLVWYVA